MDASDKTILELLLKIGSICGITPPNKNSKWNPTFHYYYSLLLITALTSLSIYSIHCNILDHYPTMGTTAATVDFLTSIFLTLQGTSVAISYLAFPKKWHCFLKHLQEGRRPTKSWWRTFCAFLELTMAHLTVFVKVSWQWLTWLPIVKIHIQKYYFFRMFHEYYGLYATCFIVLSNKIMRGRFIWLNQSLKRSKCQQGHLRHLQGVYRRLLGTMEEFNCAFGYQILFVMGNTIAVVLECFLNALKSRNAQIENDSLVFFWAISSAIIALVQRPIPMVNSIVAFWDCRCKPSPLWCLAIGRCKRRARSWGSVRSCKKGFLRGLRRGRRSSDCW